MSLWPRLPCFSTVFTASGCLLLSILPHQISHQAWLWHRITVSFSLKLFSAMPVLLKCLEDLINAQPSPDTLSSPRVYLSLVHSSCSCPRVISEFTSALSQPEEASCILTVWSSLDWSIDVSFLLLVPDPLSLSTLLWLCEFIYY